MFKASNPKIVFDPYLYLPQFGEQDIMADLKDNNLYLKIIFEEEETQINKLLIIEFENIIFFKVESFPGVKGMDVNYEYGDLVSNLIEFENSELKDAWEKHFNGQIELFHYKIFFLNINKSIEAISEKFLPQKVTVLG